MTEFMTRGPSWFGIWNHPWSRCQPSRNWLGSIKGIVYWLVPVMWVTGGAVTIKCDTLGHPRTLQYFTAEQDGQPNIISLWLDTMYCQWYDDAKCTSASNPEVILFPHPPQGMMMQNAHQYQKWEVIFPHSPNICTVVLERMFLPTIIRGFPRWFFLLTARCLERQ